MCLERERAALQSTTPVVGVDSQYGGDYAPSGWQAVELGCLFFKL